MTRAEFWILNGFSALLSVLIGFELFSADNLDDAQTRERRAEIPLLQAQQLQPLARRILERTAQGAARDPALKDLLGKYGFQVAAPPASDSTGIAATANSAPSTALPPHP